jgi:hypothetical protein
MKEYLAENTRLRQLSRAYANGHMAVEDYRAARRELFALLESGKAGADVPLPLLPENEVSAADSTSPRVDGGRAEMAMLKTLPPQAMSAANTGVEKTMPPQRRESLAGAQAADRSATPDDTTVFLAWVLGAALLLAVAALVYVFIL